MNYPLDIISKELVRPLQGKGFYLLNLVMKYIRVKFHSKILMILAVILLTITGLNGQKPGKTSAELKKDIKYLSSNALQGRMTGSKGDSLAAAYIKIRLSSCGFKPLTESGFQQFRVTKRIVSGNGNRLAINNIRIPGKDFMPLAFSSDDSLSAEVLFAGYGFSIKNDSLNWNDYAGIDVKNKWVLLLRADPEPDKPSSFFIQYSSDRNKAIIARDMGAAGILLVSGTSYDSKDDFEPLNTEGYSVNIPVLRIKRETADLILSPSGKNINILEKEINEKRQSIAFQTGVTVSGKADIIRQTAGTRNVVMILPGEDPVLKNEYVVIGAHFDHLGMGGPGSSSRAVDTTAIHPGADDNASGVALMLELAEKFANTKNSHGRSIICVAFTGEEEGLLGSKHFTEDPGIDLTKVNAMINLDMVGRLNEENLLHISGVGTAEGLKDIVKTKTDTSKIRLVLSEEGYGPSDHSSFYGKNIPVLFFFTGAHLDYHTPADTWDKINYNGMAEISDIVYSIAHELSSSEKRLTFREAGPKATPSTRTMRGVTLGIMPDFAGVVKNGLRADFVTPGKPASLGGMKKGDIITAINGKTVNNIEDYMFRMGELKHGQTINVEVLRGDKKEVLLIQL